MRIVHLMASPFFGGPERQVLGLARHLPSDVTSSFLSFPERGLAQPFLNEATKHGFEARALQYNAPRFLACVSEITAELRRLKADALCTSGYKPDILGWRAARRVGIPVIAIAHGWTGATWKVRLYETLDRFVMRRVDRVVCVSKAQADKVRAAGVADTRIAVIQNSIGADAFLEPDAQTRAEMLGWFTHPPRHIIGSAGRLSPEKGFPVFIDAAAALARTRPDAGFVLFGDGPLRPDLERRIAERGLQGRFVLAGFRTDLNRYLPNLDLTVMSSYTEGLPVFLLEAGAAGVPTVATRVGGIPEVIDEGITGYMVPPGDASTLAQRINILLDYDAQRQVMSRMVRDRIRQHFSFTTMSERYRALFKSLLSDES